jgi:hypothetical protein
MTPGRDLVPEAFEGAAWPFWRKVGAQRGSHGVAQLRQRAAEELATGLEFRTQSKETERVVTRDIQAAAELVKQCVEVPAAIRREAVEPRRHELRRALVHAPNCRIHTGSTCASLGPTV